MSTNSSYRLVVAAMVLTTGTAGFPVHAQTTGLQSAGVLPAISMPLAASVDAAAREHSRLLAQTPAPPPRRRSCGKGVATGLAIGAGAGLALAGGLLASTGGSDSTYRILFSFTGLGAGIGGLLGSSQCVK